MNESNQIDQLLDRLAGLLRAEIRAIESADSLQPVQLEVLDYLARANRFSDTAKAVTEYLGQTKGTVSQTIKVLEARGLVTKTPDPEDRRVAHLVLTDKGRQLRAGVKPSRLLQGALQTMPQPEVKQLATGLTDLLSAMQRHNKSRAFGQCRDCSHNQQNEAGYWCGLTQQPLSSADIELICLEFEELGK